MADDDATSPTNSGTSSYQYEPLGPGIPRTRILTLEASHSWTSEICCRLTTVNLDPELIVEAISYTWGDGAESKPINLEGHCRLVGANLESFLRHRRETYKPVDLWIDALCINQNDPIEKGKQVRIMNLIFGTFSKVTIWLGPAADESDISMEELRNLGGGSPFQKMPILKGTVLKAVENLLNRKWWFRVWIVQEVFFGGAGRKLQDIRVRCGQKEVSWVNLVIAAARIQAHKDDQRQYFPSVENILNLEEIRTECEERMLIPANESSILDLISGHRHFQSTDPRDKIYALLGMAFKENLQPFSGITIDYLASTREVYKSFALFALQYGSNLEILRHCQARSIETLPSWVPDWSIYETQDEDNREKYTYRIRSSRAPEQEGGNDGSIVDETMPKAFRMNTIAKSISDTLAPELKESLKARMDEGTMVWVGMDSDPDSDAETDPYDPKTEDAATARAIRKGESITRRREEGKSVLKSVEAATKYEASGGTKPVLALEPLTDVLTAEGVLWDTIDMLHDPFVDNVDADWENSTHFMVAVGECKRDSLHNHTCPNPYETGKARIEAFWLTLFAGRSTVSGRSGVELDIKDHMRFQEWLPNIPASWSLSAPPLTVLNTGRLEPAQFCLVEADILRGLAEMTGLDPNELSIEMPGTEVLTNLQPQEWTESDQEYYTAKFQELGSLWKNQPFDLYYRPFSLPTVVLDPFWDARQQEDKTMLTKGRSRERESFICATEVLQQNVSASVVRRLLEDSLAKVVPIIPGDTLPPGFETYALGRRFFVTERGYMGLGPKGAKKGDKVGVLLGSDVPFVLRSRPIGGFELVGEAYVQGIMKGEVIGKVKEGSIELEKLTLR